MAAERKAERMDGGEGKAGRPLRGSRPPARQRTPGCGTASERWSPSPTHSLQLCPFLSSFFFSLFSLLSSLFSLLSPLFALRSSFCAFDSCFCFQFGGRGECGVAARCLLTGSKGGGSCPRSGPEPGDMSGSRHRAATPATSSPTKSAKRRPTHSTSAQSQEAPAAAGRNPLLPSRKKGPQAQAGNPRLERRKYSPKGLTIFRSGSLSANQDVAVLRRCTRRCAASLPGGEQT